MEPAGSIFVIVMRRGTISRRPIPRNVRGCRPPDGGEQGAETWPKRSQSTRPDAMRRARGGCAGECLSARSEEHTSELQSLMRISYAVFCLKQKKHQLYINQTTPILQNTTTLSLNILIDTPHHSQHKHI